MERIGKPDEKLGSAFVIAWWKQSEGVAEPITRRAWSVHGGVGSSPRKHIDRTFVAHAPAAMEVRGDPRSVLATREKCGSRALMSGVAGALGHRLIHRTPDDRVPELEFRGAV